MVSSSPSLLRIKLIRPLLLGYIVDVFARPSQSPSGSTIASPVGTALIIRFLVRKRGKAMHPVLFGHMLIVEQNHVRPRWPTELYFQPFQSAWYRSSNYKWGNSKRQWSSPRCRTRLRGPSSYCGPPVERTTAKYRLQPSPERQ